MGKMSFFECEFPRSIGFVSSGGDVFQTQVNEGFSGDEQRNQNWKKSRRQFQVPINGKPLAYLELLRAFFLNVHGKADGFRFFWPLDCQIKGQLIGVGDGAAFSYQLKKVYEAGDRAYTFPIYKPIMGSVQTFRGDFLTDTVLIYRDGVPAVLGTDYDVDASTGLVTLTSVPAAGVLITADCDFHIPVRFNTDTMADVQILSQDRVVKWPNVMLQELKNKPEVFGS